MRATYTVTTKNGNVYTWNFTEGKSEGDYGNGIYIAVKSPSGDISMLDCRYSADYRFDKYCAGFLTEYYGDNLEELHLQRICRGIE